MATIAIASQDRQHGYIVVTWEAIGNADGGSPYVPPVGYEFVAAQATGTFGGGTFKVQGSINGTDFEDIEATGITAAGIVSPTHQALSYRPETTGGTGTDIDASFLFKAIN